MATTILTAEEFVRQYGGQMVELIDGRVEEVPMGRPRHGKIFAKVAALLLVHVECENLGTVAANDTAVATKRGPDSVRGAEVCYWNK